MTDKKIKELFTKSEELAPRAELKNEILEKARQQMSAGANAKKEKTARLLPIKKILYPIAACFIFVFVAVGVFVGLSGENYQTVYIDVNPSVSLEINRFGKVSGVNYINIDAQEALSDVSLKGKSADTALEKIILAYDGAGYFSENAELNISAVEKGKDTDKLLEKLEKCAEKIKGSKKYTVNVSKLSEDEREQAKEYGISPGKYKVISAIIEANPEYTVEELIDKSMAELKNLLPKSDDKNDKNDKNDKKEK